MSDVGRLVRFTDEADGVQAIQCRQQGVLGRVVSDQFNEPGVIPEHYYVVVVPLFENPLYCEPKDIEVVEEPVNDHLKALAAGVVNWAKVAEDEHKEVEKLITELAVARDLLAKATASLDFAIKLLQHPQRLTWNPNGYWIDDVLYRNDLLDSIKEAVTASGKSCDKGGDCTRN